MIACLAQVWTGVGRPAVNLGARRKQRSLHTGGNTGIVPKTVRLIYLLKANLDTASLSYENRGHLRSHLPVTTRQFLHCPGNSFSLS